MVKMTGNNGIRLKVIPGVILFEEFDGVAEIHPSPDDNPFPVAMAQHGAGIIERADPLQYLEEIEQIFFGGAGQASGNEFEQGNGIPAREKGTQ
jgi:hypothetical protein